MTAENLKEGDIFRWRWNDEEYERRNAQRPSSLYWCMSRIAVVKDGILRDTYWYSGSDNAVLDPAKVVLDFKGNASEMTVINRWEAVFYRPDDIMDMSHPNNSGGTVYARIGAKRDPAVMKEYYAEKIQQTAREIESAERRVTEYENAIVQIDDGKIDGYFPLYCK